MLFKFLTVFLALFATLQSFAQSFNYLPSSTTNQVISHTYFTLSYSETHEQAEWVAYLLTAKRLTGSIERSNKFRSDKLVISGSASPGDYSKSGYDKGHLAPAADMQFDSIAMKECFFMSNMSPQNPSFNRGIWKQLEEQVRKWAIENDSIYIVTGGVLKDSLGSIGENKVAIPKYFYKVILDYTEPDIKAIALLLPNEAGNQYLQDYTVTIDSLESFTGIDFFPALPDSIENKLESTKNTYDWFSIKPNNSTTIPQTGNAIQCSASTKSGTRCKRMTTSPNGKCYQHGGD